MIKIASGDIFAGEPDILVNPVNTVGVMGAGLAKQFKERFPDIEKPYKSACKNKQLKIGAIFSIINDHEDIIFFPTKEHWKNNSKLSYIESAMPSFMQYLSDRAMIRRVLKREPIVVHIPALGCGLGGLDFGIVAKLLNKNLKNIKFLHARIFKPC